MPAADNQLEHRMENPRKQAPVRQQLSENFLAVRLAPALAREGLIDGIQDHQVDQRSGE